MSGQAFKQSTLSGLNAAAEFPQFLAAGRIHRRCGGARGIFAGLAPRHADEPWQPDLTKKQSGHAREYQGALAGQNRFHAVTLGKQSFKVGPYRLTGFLV